MHIDYNKFLLLPNSKVKKLVDIAFQIREYKIQTEGLGALAQVFGGKPK